MARPARDAHWLTSAVLSKADFYLDLHGGDLDPNPDAVHDLSTRRQGTAGSGHRLRLLRAVEFEQVLRRIMERSFVGSFLIRRRRHPASAQLARVELALLHSPRSARRAR